MFFLKMLTSGERERRRSLVEKGDYIDFNNNTWY